MCTAVTVEKNQELHELCSTVRTLVMNGDYEKCTNMISAAMGEYPHNPEPHNLMGIVLERVGDHCTAMKHFRAAWALDPTYRPAGVNLHNYGTFSLQSGCAFDESDCEEEKPNRYVLSYNDQGVAEVIRR